MTRKSTIDPTVAKLAKRLHADAIANGTLKSPKPLGVLGLSNGPSHVAQGSKATWRDYIPEARQALNEV